MALLQASQVSSLSLPQFYNVDAGELQSTPPHASDPVTLTLSSGTVVTVADSLTTLLKVLRQMQLSGQWLLHLSSSVMMVSIAGVKALLLERTIINEKLIQHFGAPLYISAAGSASVKFASRSSYETKDISNALAAMGKLMTGDPPLDNASLASLQIQVADWHYQAGAATGQGSTLIDSPILIYI